MHKTNILQTQYAHTTFLYNLGFLPVAENEFRIFQMSILSYLAYRFDGARERGSVHCHYA